MEYFEVAARSYYSFLNGASSPSSLSRRAFDEGYRGIAISDLGNFLGAVKGLRMYEKIQEGAGLLRVLSESSSEDPKNTAVRDVSVVKYPPEPLFHFSSGVEIPWVLPDPKLHHMLEKIERMEVGSRFPKPLFSQDLLYTLILPTNENDFKAICRYLSDDDITAFEDQFDGVAQLPRNTKVLPSRRDVHKIRDPLYPSFSSISPEAPEKHPQSFTEKPTASCLLQKKNLEGTRAQKSRSFGYFLDIFKDTEALVIILSPWWDRFHRAIEVAFEMLSSRLYLGWFREQSRFQAMIEAQVRQFARKKGLPLVACQRVLYGRPEEETLYNALRAIDHRIPLKKSNPRVFVNSGGFYLRPLQELQRLWQDEKEPIKKTLEIRERLRFSLRQLRYTYPQPRSVPEKVSLSRYLENLCTKNFSMRIPQEARASSKELLERELELIDRLGLHKYFLTLYEIIDWAKSKGIFCQGRGSAANSIVCFLLGITSVSPLSAQFCLERFIHQKRAEPPDIDIDFDSHRREEVFQFIWEHYGVEHAAQVSNVITFGYRSSIREVGIILGFEDADIETLQKSFERDPMQVWEWTSIQQGLLSHISSEDLRLWVELSHALRDLPHHIGLHSGGFLLSEGPIWELGIVKRSAGENRLQILWNKDDCDDLGWMKVDLLGLGMLSALERSFRSLREKLGISLELYQIPVDDPKTFALIQKADTVGVFQIESRAQMSLLPRSLPQNYFDLSCQIALVRPGPIEGQLLKKYIVRRQKKMGKGRYSEEVEETIYEIYPSLRPVLERTYGVPIFQEQIVRFLSIVLHISLEDAELCRRELGRSDRVHGEGRLILHRVREELTNRGLNAEEVERWMRVLKGFQAYGFPESHAASFAHLALASSYLKAHFAPFFYLGLINAQPMGFYSVRALLLDARRHGVRILPVSLWRSHWEWIVENVGEGARTQQEYCNRTWAIRMGFSAVQGLTRPLWEKLLTEGRDVHLTVDLRKSAFEFSQFRSPRREMGKGEFSMEDIFHAWVSLKNRYRIPTPEWNKVIRLGALEPFLDLPTYYKYTQKNFFYPRSKTMSERESAFLPPSFTKGVDITRELVRPKGAIEGARDGKEPIALDLSQLLSFRFKPFEVYQTKRGRQIAYESEVGYQVDSHILTLTRQKHADWLSKYPCMSSKELEKIQSGSAVRLLGLWAMRQRPPTAKGVTFFLMEDEWGLYQVILPPVVYHKYRMGLPARPPAVLILMGKKLYSPRRSELYQIEGEAFYTLDSVIRYHKI